MLYLGTCSVNHYGLPAGRTGGVAADPARLARLAWHIGNRHLPTEIAGALLYLRHDHVIAAMLERLGATVRFVDRPVNPEGGAYGHGRTYGHDDHDHHDHHHD